MLSLKKLEKIAFLSLDNALRLHYDAIALYRDGRFPSAFYLSILSQEEIGKMHIVNDFLWHSRTEGRMPEFEEEWLGYLYKHPYKQTAFLRNSPLHRHWSPQGLALMEEVSNGSLEAKKQTAVYVGLQRSRGRIDTKGRVKHPYQITKLVAQAQITKINDYFLVTGLGCRFGFYSLDSDELEAVLKNKRFLKSSFQNWSHLSPSARSRISVLQKSVGEEVISV